MRVLVVDQDSASNESIVRSLREHYTVDAVTNKGDCLDLLRSNTFEVIVAAEKLEDGSGLELLGQVGKRWPSVLRIFAADRHRLQLLRGRLGPFELFQTLAYPIDPEKLISTLNLAGAAQDANADTSDIQHVVLSGESPPETEEPAEATAETAEAEHFPAPKPAARAASREWTSAPSPRRAPPRTAPSQRAHATPVGRPRRSGRWTAGAAAPVTRAAHVRPTPARIKPMEPPREPPQRPSGFTADSFSEAAAMARAARSNFDSPAEELDSRRLLAKVGGGAAVVLVVILAGFKIFGSKTPPAHPAAPPVVQVPQYSQEVVNLIAQTEAAFTADDFKSARVDVDRLQALAPSHPRLPFFESLLKQRAESVKDTAPTSRSASNKRNGQSSKRLATNGPPSETPPAPVASIAASVSSATPAASDTAASPGAPAAPVAGPTQAPQTTPGSDPAQALASAPTEAASPASASAPAAASSPGTPSSTATSSSLAAAAPPAPAVTSPTTGLTAAATSAPQPAAPVGGEPDRSQPAQATASTRRASSSEPPPVVREAKLIRRVNPDYPSAARRDGIQGSVDLDVTVSPTGAVEDVAVSQSTPRQLFDKAAIAAVRKWKYDPRFVDGLPSQAHLKVHLDFAPAN